MVQLRAKFATYVTWEELSGSPSTLEQLRNELSKLPRLQVVNACALVNIVLKTWQGNIDVDEHAQLLKAVFSQDFATQLDKLARTVNPPRFVFHRQQLLFLIKEAAVHSRGDIDNLGAEFNAAFARCCLKANDLLHHGLAFHPEKSRVERLMPEAVTVNDYTYRESILRKTARTRILLERMLTEPQIKESKEFVDIPKLFSAVTGLTIREYANLVFAILTKYLKLTLALYLANPKQFVLSGSYFDGTHVEPEKITRFFQEIAINPQGLRDACAQRKQNNDFTPLRDRPLLEIPDQGLIPLDIGFVADKLETGVFWRVHYGALKSKKDRDSLHAFWGELFHHYVSQLLQDVCQSSPNGFMPNPQFKNTGEACDGLITCGPNAVLIEAKGSMLTAEAKYSGSSEQLMEELGLKFVGTEEKPKGVRQLARTIQKYGNKKEPEPIRGLGGVATIFPVLVARESSLASPFVNRYLNEIFQSLYNRKQVRPRVTPLFVLSIDELEEISPYLADTRLDQILESKYKEDTSQSFPFSAVRNELLASLPQRVNESLEEKFDSIVDDACRDLFGKPFREVHIDDILRKAAQDSGAT